MRTVLVAGLWLDARAWAEVVPALAELAVDGVPVSLPGQGAPAPEGRATTLDDQLAAVVAEVDATPEGEQVVVVGHSAASTLAWAAADARLDRVAGVVLVGGVPTTDGTAYADFFPPADDVVPFPGWEPFEGPGIADLDAEARAALAALTLPVPHSVTTSTVRYTDARRRDVPVVLVCCEFTPEQAREWIAGDVPELQQATRLRLVDLDAGHWPMASAPVPFARCLAEAAAWCANPDATA
ncbi:alpha/beta fold hydrolase [Nocardioides solisilvae]|uniref:alpha/beta fold hydrolase n=1 Tax=Nocardioides solisilvae TaxID=1542435 RepID=UPI000D744948|nr:alpha/beta hydrolase [Nocardioides solisilvae]